MADEEAPPEPPPPPPPPSVEPPVEPPVAPPVQPPDSPDSPPSEKAVDPYFPIYVVSALAAIIFVFGPILVRKGPNRGIIRCCIMLTSISLWLFWVTIYISQINPLVGPRLDNVTLAWVGHCWGDDPKSLS